MAVKHCGLTVVPIESSLVRALGTLVRSSANDVWENQIAQYGRSFYGGADIPIVPDGPFYMWETDRFFVLDTDEGRKVVVIWKGKTIPLIDWYTTEGDLERYLQELKVAIADREKKIAKAKKRKKSSRAYTNRWTTEIFDLQDWCELLREALRYRDSVRLFEEKWDKELVREVRQDGLEVPELNFSFYRGLRDIHIVADSYFYQDVKLCHVDTGVSTIRTYANACSNQANFAELKYKVTGDSRDLAYYSEKLMKSRMDKALILKKMQVASSEKRASFRLRRQLASHLGVSESEVLDRWRVLSQKFYIKSYEQTGRWDPPLVLEDLLGQEFSVMSSILWKYGDPLHGQQRSRAYLGVEYVQDSYSVDEVKHDRLVKYMPVRDVVTRESGQFIFRSQESARLHFSTRPQVVC